MITGKLIISNLIQILKITKKIQPIFFIYIAINFVLVLGYSYLIILVPSTVLQMFITQQIDLGLLCIIFTGILICGIGSAICKYFYTPIALKVRFYLLYQLMEKNLSIPLEKYDDSTYLDDMQNMYYPVSSANGVQLQLTNFALLLENIAILIISLCFVVKLNVVLMLVILVWIVLYSWLSIKYNNEIAKVYTKGSPLFREGSYIDDICLDVAYAKEFRVFQLSEWILEKRTNINHGLHQMYRKIYSFSSRLTGLNHIYQFIRDVIIYGFLIYLFFTKQVSLPLCSSYCFMIIQFNHCLSNLIKNMENMSKRAIEYPKLFEYISIENELKTGKHILDYLHWNIVFDHVSFHYPNQKTEILHDVCFNISQGDKIAVIGLNGAGKTTMMKLLMHLYQPTSGTIYMNGINIQLLNLDEYYNLFAPVFQEMTVFPYSIKENIVFDLQEIDNKVLDKVLQQVGLDEKLCHDQYDDVMTKYFDEKGIVLSGGEEQRLSLARAIFSNRQIFVLDEPTSALDAIAEYQFYSQIHREFKEKTILFISHRLASTSFCDYIILIEDGGISEVGTHEELMIKKGSYFKLFESQSKYYREGTVVYEK